MSLDLMFRGLFALGGTMKDIQIAGPPAAAARVTSDEASSGVQASVSRQAATKPTPATPKRRRRH